MNSGNANGSDSSAPYQWRAIAEHWGPTMLLVLIAAGLQVLLFFRNLTGPGWTALLWMAFGAQLVGAALIAAAKMPAYRAGRHFTFGQCSIPSPLRGAYRWGWRCFTTGALVCMGLLLSTHG
ncbi:MAG: hypothetical protein IT581_19120 [Verrucomicrobiales bacterium]|nr:hypothetical protein [Verrucomicrobiales bacterium]